MLKVLQSSVCSEMMVLAEGHSSELEKVLVEGHRSEVLVEEQRSGMMEALVEG